MSEKILNAAMHGSGYMPPKPIIEREAKVEVKMERLAQKIQLRLRERGLSRFEFANLMEVQPSIVTRWLSGKHNFTVATIFEIEQKLDFNIINIGESNNHSSIQFRLSVSSEITTLSNLNELVQGPLAMLRLYTRPFTILDDTIEPHTEKISSTCSYLVFHQKMTLTTKHGKR